MPLFKLTSYILAKCSRLENILKDPSLRKSYNAMQKKLAKESKAAILKPQEPIRYDDLKKTLDDTKNRFKFSKY